MYSSFAFVSTYDSSLLYGSLPFIIYGASSCQGCAGWRCYSIGVTGHTQGQLRRNGSYFSHQRKDYSKTWRSGKKNGYCENNIWLLNFVVTVLSFVHYFSFHSASDGSTLFQSEGWCPPLSIATSVSYYISVAEGGARVMNFPFSSFIVPVCGKCSKASLGYMCHGRLVRNSQLGAGSLSKYGWIIRFAHSTVIWTLEFNFIIFFARVADIFEVTSKL